MPPGPHDAGELAQRRGRIVDVAQEVRERQRVELAVGERQRLRASLDELDPAEPVPHARAPCASISALWSTPTTAAAARTSARATAAVPVATSSARRRPGDAGDEERAPARVLAVREQRRVAVVGRAERREQLPSAAAASRR